MRIAVIGGGISGLAAAWLLHGRHEVILYEAEKTLGGHARTVDALIDGKKVPVDTGFIVFNETTYPNLCGLFSHLGVTSSSNDMSFSYHTGCGKIAYALRRPLLLSLFAQKKNLVRPAFWGLLRDILRFNRKAGALLCGNDLRCLYDYCRDEGFGSWFLRYYLLAMSGAIWSTPADGMAAFPAQSLAAFYSNHGLLNARDTIKWKSVIGGSRVYVEKMAQRLKGATRLGVPVARVSPAKGGICVRDARGSEDLFDQVIVATHANQALAILDECYCRARDYLHAFAYKKNALVLHRDASLMPQRKAHWACWSVRGEHTGSNSGGHTGSNSAGRADFSTAGRTEFNSGGRTEFNSGGRTEFNSGGRTAINYWMNALQKLPLKSPIIATLNPLEEPKAELILDRTVFSHPQFDYKALAMQKHTASVQGIDGLWFCGAYQGWGFHEDGLRSALLPARRLGATIPWTLS